MKWSTVRSEGGAVYVEWDSGRETLLLLCREIADNRNPDPKSAERWSARQVAELIVMAIRDMSEASGDE